MAQQQAHFHRGDVVIHTRRPEWGRGVVDQVVAITHQGQPAQRLTIKFTHRGRVTVNTAIASLASAESITKDSGTDHPLRTDSGEQPTPYDPLVVPDRRDTLQDLESLPTAMTDPFLSLETRLIATLDSYRFSADSGTFSNPRDPRRLQEWAIAQTHLTDPLTRFTRHDLEEAFARFSQERNRHLFQLIGLIRKQGHKAILQQARQRSLDPVARAALESIMTP